MFSLRLEQGQLYEAVMENDEKSLENYLENSNINLNFEIGRSKSRLIHFAVDKGNLAMVNLLISHNAELHHFDILGRTPLILAAEIGNQGIAKALLKANATVDASGSIKIPGLPVIVGLTALHAAALKDDIAMMKLLLSYGANIQAIKIRIHNIYASKPKSIFDKDYNTLEETALDMVRRKGLVKAESFLLENGADTAPAHQLPCAIL